MTHPFRHELEAALARIEQLESALAHAEQRAPLARRLWFRVRVPLAISAMSVCTLTAVGLSSVLVARMDEPDPVPLEMSDVHANVRTQIVTVAPRGLSAWQVGEVASRNAAALDARCGGVTEPLGMTLSLDIAANGTVSRAHAEGPEALSRCTEMSAEQWAFPTSDGVTHATVPLYYRPSLAAGARPVRLPAAGLPWDRTRGEPESGSLAVVCAPACDTVLVDGTPIGRTPIISHPAQFGRHVVELISGTRKRTVTAYVRSRQVTEIREDLSDSGSESTEDEDLGLAVPAPL